MRMLGTKTSLQSFRWDLIYLLAQLLGDKRPGVSALAPPIQASLATLTTERGTLEGAEDQAIVAAALLNKSDKHRDDLLIEAGGVARATDKAVYDTLFSKQNPSATARLGIDAESAEVSRILGELAKLPASHPIRATYEADLTDTEVAVKAASNQSNSARTALALQRSQIERTKLEVDKTRLETHGQLLALLKNKDEADSFFRPTTAAPEEAIPPAKPEPVSPPAPPAP